MTGFDKKNFVGVCMLILYSMLILTVMILAVVDGKLFCAFTDSRAQNEKLRSTLSYLQNKIQASGDKDEVSIISGENGLEIVLTEGTSGYVTKIYKSGGYLVEALVSENSTEKSETANEICKISSFSVSFVNDRLIKVTVDGKSALACLRCEGGG